MAELFEPQPILPQRTLKDVFKGGMTSLGTEMGPAPLVNPVIVGKTTEDKVFVTYTFYDHVVDAGTGQGNPATIVIDRDCTIRKVYIHVETAPGAGTTLTVDINKNGTTIFTTQGHRPSITGTNTVDDSGAPDVVKLIKNDSLTMDVDTDDGAAARLSVYIRCQE